MRIIRVARRLCALFSRRPIRHPIQRTMKLHRRSRIGIRSHLHIRRVLLFLPSLVFHRDARRIRPKHHLEPRLWRRQHRHRRVNHRHLLRLRIATTIVPPLACGCGVSAHDFLRYARSTQRLSSSSGGVVVWRRYPTERATAGGVTPYVRILVTPHVRTLARQRWREYTFRARRTAPQWRARTTTTTTTRHRTRTAVVTV